MLVRAFVLLSIGFKALVRIKSKAAFLDLGDVILAASLVLTGRKTWKDPFALPSSAGLVAASVSFAGLYCFSALLRKLLRTDDELGKNGINAGGAYQSLSGVEGKRLAAAAALFCVAGAMFEEYLFRHAFFGMLSLRTGRVGATFLQAGAFAAVHAVPAAFGKKGSVTAYATIFPFISALALQWVYVAGEGVVAPAVVHWALNVVAVSRAKAIEGKVYGRRHGSV